MTLEAKGRSGRQALGLPKSNERKGGRKREVYAFKNSKFKLRTTERNTIASYGLNEGEIGRMTVCGTGTRLEGVNGSL